VRRDPNRHPMVIAIWTSTVVMLHNDGQQHRCSAQESPDSEDGGRIQWSSRSASKYLSQMGSMSSTCLVLKYASRAHFCTDALRAAGGVGRAVEVLDGWTKAYAGRRCGVASGTPTSWWGRNGSPD
jgi:hypothetical protein